MKYFVIEFHNGLFNYSGKSKYNTVSEHDTLDLATKHYNRVKDNCQHCVIAEQVTEKVLVS